MSIDGQVAIPERRAVHHQNIGIVWNQCPFFCELGLVKVEGPVAKARLPGRAPNLQSSKRGAAVFEIYPVSDRSANSWPMLESEIMIAGDADHPLGRDVSEPAFKGG